jgi:putative transposase
MAKMGRLLRPDDDGLTFHAINRDVVLADDDDHLAFLHSLSQTQPRYPFRLYGYCLMSNHFHLLIRPEPGITISRVLQSLTVAHTYRFHRRHHTVGHVWQGRFKSPVVQTDDHLWAVLRYIEANPLRAGMVADPAAYRWSSYPAHGEGRADPLLTPLPEWSDLGPDEPSRRAAWRRKVMAEQPATDVDSIRRSLRGGLPFGDAAWVEEMAGKLGQKLERRPPGRPRKAERLA